MTDEELLERLEREWVEALRRGDAETLGRIWDDEFVFTDPGGRSLSREQCLRDLASGTLRLEHAELRRMRVQVFDLTGVVLGYISLRGRAGDTTYDGDYSFVDVYAKRGGRWRAVLSSGDRAKQMLA
jgi:ketosteroid isomerase-like protein